MAAEIISKTCTKCKQSKSLSEFNKCLRNKDGHHPWCRSCQNIYQRQYEKTEKGKTVNQRSRKSEKGRATQNRRDQTEERKAHLKRYARSEEGKIVQDRFRKSEKGKANRRRFIKLYKIRHPERSKAVEKVNDAVKAGRLPRPNSLQCHDCAAQAKQYHHWHGYAPEHCLDVIPVCAKCHKNLHLAHRFSSTAI